MRPASIKQKSINAARRRLLLRLHCSTTTVLLRRYVRLLLRPLLRLIILPRTSAYVWLSAKAHQRIWLSAKAHQRMWLTAKAQQRTSAQGSQPRRISTPAHVALNQGACGSQPRRMWLSTTVLRTTTATYYDYVLRLLVRRPPRSQARQHTPPTGRAPQTSDDDAGGLG